jgi:hexosaminidase
MKKYFLFLSMSCFSWINAQQPLVSLIPRPVELQQLNGSFSLTSRSTICFNKAEAKSVAEMFVLKLKTASGFMIKPSLGNAGEVQFNLLEVRNNTLGDEGYTLKSGTKSVIISANRPAGLFYGLQTLYQLLPAEIEAGRITKTNWVIPAVSITDYPRFGWRGLMLDVSRHFYTKEEVKHYIDQMVAFKMNVFHWHLTDDNGWRIEIKSLPLLTKIGAWRVMRYGSYGDRPDPLPGEPATYGGFYTQEDIREVVQYAKDRNVTIVPEVDVPGHSMALLAAYPELSCSKDTSTKVNPGTNFAEWYGDGKFRMFIDNTLNPSDEAVYAILDKIFTEMAALFPGEYIHVGGDECYKGFWEKSEACQALMKKMGYQHVEQLQGYFMNRVETILKAKGKHLIGWDEILEGGISPDATVMSWRGINGGIEAAKLGHNVVMTPSTFAYLDYQQGEESIEPPVYSSLLIKKCYSFNPVPEGVDAKYILGGQGNLWTEQLPTYSSIEYMTYPRAWALAEIYWSPVGTNKWEEFVPRLENEFMRAKIAGINFSRAVYDVLVTAEKNAETILISLETEMPGLDIYYTIDGTMPNTQSPKYSTPVLLPPGNITLRAISYRNGDPIGHLIYLKPEDLKKRAGM